MPLYLSVAFSLVTLLNSPENRKHHLLSPILSDDEIHEQVKTNFYYNTRQIRCRFSQITFASIIRQIRHIETLTWFQGLN